ncbi:general transcription factor 3C polypeptide 6 [Diretmus argenteus]
MEDEWEEEEQLVVVELSGGIDNDFLSKCCGTCKIVDVDSEKPMMQVGQYVFAGEYEDTVGTCVLFEEGPLSGDIDDCPELKYKCHTTKKLMMQRIFLSEKKEGETSTGSGDSGELKDTSSHSSQDVSQQEEAGEKMNQVDSEDMAVG